MPQYKFDNVNQLATTHNGPLTEISYLCSRSCFLSEFNWKYYFLMNVSAQKNSLVLYSLNL